MDYVFPSEELIRRDYWRAVMYAHIERWLETQQPQGAGVEMGGSNGIIQSFCPSVDWENRDFPEYDVLDASTWDGEWDMVVLDQVLEHTLRPWEVFQHLGRVTRGAAIVTMPFMLAVHPCPGDYWRMTPEMMILLAAEHFPVVHVNSWGNTLATWWLQVYRETEALLGNVSEPEYLSALADNDPMNPLVIWGLFRR